MTPRRLSVVVRQLLEDPSSALLRAVSPDPLWSTGDWIAADMFDLTAASVAGKAAKPYPRPGDRRREQEQQQQRLDALRAQQERIRRRQSGEGT